MAAPLTVHRSSNQGLDASLRGHLETNSDIVTRITKPVRMDDIGALSAQSDQPILFENIVEKPGFRLCDILVKNRRSQARALGVDPAVYLKTLGLSPAPAAARLQEREDRSGEGSGQARRRCRLDQAADPVPQGQGCRAVRDGDEYHQGSGDRILQFVPCGDPCGRSAARTCQLCDAALSHHHAQVSRDGRGIHADCLRLRRSAGLRNHGEFLRSPHGFMGRDGDGRHDHGSRRRNGALRDARSHRAGGSRDRCRGPDQVEQQGSRR